MRSARVVAVCGPTASGKSEVADELSALLTEAEGVWVPTVVVDSMQVYREIPEITNQARSRPAELVGVVPVTREWTVAEHRRRARAAIEGSGAGAAVLDAGTGMYLNATVLDIPLAPKVPREIRALAQRAAAGAANPRREARRLELELYGAPERGSIWEGEPAYELALIYLRPERASLDEAIARRSSRIARRGLADARRLQDLLEAGARVNPSVLGSIGVRELLSHLRGEISLPEAEETISVRTRHLARRQMRWFDKLARTLSGRARLVVSPSPEDPALRKALHSMHDIIGA
ncbi:tRNA isopentenyltransferase [Rubrobacter xylanophilus DSM 9941]|uniref:tRNA dimethylallyltransferase n=1 Tax=Rubrobacter xylanophilus (strain DSM 9941 / JCM 11954 / NBRC 16129 / PRD-1) TaxID=266117 RepID=MIAA_RUBXD|nr:tRNA dimethylallyltransferase [Rubrobacter xylanophilus]Q1AW38.1 RecName: Full=tRNA dimethylallyltransferase; AltName: Full=Dimethylallyl diphosphate:tRNA dimethylallyltransferase; Short=DMAPP:tRNA dimethylallyltransferase; Short=DMATase; AltName: Full=Isopentenyl-diphosphate:tRNA isopentenyltransferase; Short=IPP transferase; Short=IPPT; Short=IPTase [Rubrobacter xylanophilus DSM 9941]ABG04390.1 tRNA isopentenyltransferase [Rubrobacter xylanophilus DSM 9941]